MTMAATIPWSSAEEEDPPLFDAMGATVTDEGDEVRAARGMNERTAAVGRWLGDAEGGALGVWVGDDVMKYSSCGLLSTEVVTLKSAVMFLFWNSAVRTLLSTTVLFSDACTCEIAEIALGLVANTVTKYCRMSSAGLKDTSSARIVPAGEV